MISATVLEVTKPFNERSIVGRVVVNPPEKRPKEEIYNTGEQWHFCKCGRAFANSLSFAKHKLEHKKEGREPALPDYGVPSSTASDTEDDDDNHADNASSVLGSSTSNFPRTPIIGLRGSSSRYKRIYSKKRPTKIPVTKSSPKVPIVASGGEKSSVSKPLTPNPSLSDLFLKPISSPKDESPGRSSKYHPNIDNRCKQCDIKFRSTRSLEKHKSTHHPEKSCFSCKYCPSKATSPTWIKFHMQRCKHKNVASPEKVPTTIANRHSSEETVFRNQNDFSKQETKSKSQKRLQVFGSKSNRSPRKRLKPSRYSSEETEDGIKRGGQVSSSETTYAESKPANSELSDTSHTRSSARRVSSASFATSDQNSLASDASSSKALQCKKCDSSFPTERALIRHCRSEHEERIQCTKCPAKFYTRKIYRLHLRKHGKENTPASKSVSTSPRVTRGSSLANSERDTIAEKNSLPHKCETCDEIFRTAIALQAHSSKHTHRFECKLCPFRTDISSSYNSHIEHAHAPEGKYPCAYCACVYKTLLGKLKHHKLVHGDNSAGIGTKDFKGLRKLDDKAKRTIRTQNAFTAPLKQFRRRPTSLNSKIIQTLSPGKLDNLVTCQLCSESITKSKFDMHMQTAHVDGGKFSCDRCCCVFNNKQELSTHKTAFHFYRSSRNSDTSTSETRSLRSSTPTNYVTPATQTTCTMCSLKIPNGPAGLLQHQKEAHVKNSKYKCIYCPCKFQSEKLRNKHCDECHPTMSPEPQKTETSKQRTRRSVSNENNPGLGRPGSPEIHTTRRSYKQIQGPSRRPGAFSSPLTKSGKNSQGNTEPHSHTDPSIPQIVSYYSENPDFSGNLSQEQRMGATENSGMEISESQPNKSNGITLKDILNPTTPTPTVNNVFSLRQEQATKALPLPVQVADLNNFWLQGNSLFSGIPGPSDPLMNTNAVITVTPTVGRNSRLRKIAPKPDVDPLALTSSFSSSSMPSSREILDSIVRRGQIKITSIPASTELPSQANPMLRDMLANTPVSVAAGSSNTNMLKCFPTSKVRESKSLPPWKVVTVVPSQAPSNQRLQIQQKQTSVIPNGSSHTIAGNAMGSPLKTPPNLKEGDFKASNFLRCNQCERYFLGQESLRQHLSAVHDVKPVIPVKAPGGKCGYCGQMFFSQSDLLSHMKACRTTSGPGASTNSPTK